MALELKYIFPLRLGLARIKTAFKGILVSARRTRSRCPAMHPAASLLTDRRRHAGFAGARLRPTTWACQHRGGITSVCGHCLFEPRLNQFSAAAWELWIHLIRERAPHLLSSAWRLESHV
jgi:hypothetical protein